MWKKRAAIAGLIFTGLLAGTAALVHTAAFKEWILRQASGALSGPDGRFSARTLSYDLTNLRFTLGDVSYTAAGIELQIDRATLDLPWRGLRGTPRVTELDADGVHIRVDLDIGGNSSAATAELPNIAIDRVRITDGSLVVLRARTAAGGDSIVLSRSR